jgi:hypothetical protein
MLPKHSKKLAGPSQGCMICALYRRTVEPLPNRKRFTTSLSHKVRQSLGHAKQSRRELKRSASYFLHDPTA